MVANEELLEKLTAGTWTLHMGLQSSVLSSSILMYGFIGIFVIIIGYEFSQNTYKNTLVSGISRLNFVLAKYIVMLLDIFILLVVYFLLADLTGVVAGRSMGSTAVELVKDTSVAILVTTFFISVVFSLAITLLITTRSQIAAGVFIVLWPTAISIIEAVAQWDWLKYIDFFGAASGIGVGTIPSDQQWRYILVSIGLLVVSTVASTVVMRRREL
jgi:ABC-2 type transport system permease protein